MAYITITPGDPRKSSTFFGYKRTYQAFSRLIGAIFQDGLTKGTRFSWIVVYRSRNYLQYRTLFHDIVIFLAPNFIIITGFFGSFMCMQKYGGNLKTVSLRLNVWSH